MNERNLLIPGAIVVAGVVIAISVLYVGGAGRRQAPSPAAVAAGAAETSRSDAASLVDDDPSLGSPSAPVTLVEFGDYQCPFCGRFFREVEPQIIERYVKTGKVRFVYRDFAFLGAESTAAAEASECADEQGKFWPYHDRLYNHLWDEYYSKGRNGENVGAFGEANLKRFAADLGLDAARFGECLSTHRYRAEVEADTASGRAAGVNGTPSTFINGRLVAGALPLAEFEALIEAALAGN